MPESAILTDSQLSAVTEWLRLVAEVEHLTLRRDEMARSLGLRPDALSSPPKKLGRPRKTQEPSTVVLIDSGYEKCEQCGKNFMSGRSMKSHITRMHVKVKDKSKKPGEMFPCPHCGKPFMRRTGLLSHIRTQHAGKSGGEATTA